MCHGFSIDGPYNFFEKNRLKKFQALGFKMGGLRVLIGRLVCHAEMKEHTIFLCFVLCS